MIMKLQSNGNIKPVKMVKSEIAEDLLEVLKKSETGKNAAMIGTVVSDHLKQVILTSSM